MTSPKFKIDYSKFQIGKRFFEYKTKSERVGFYPVNGTNVVNVTTILDIRSKPGLRNWYVKKALESGDADAGTKEASKAATRGGKLHDYFENDLSGGELPELQPNETPYLAAWSKFKQEHEIKFIDAEKLLCHLDYGYAGKTDVVAEIDGVPCIADYKTVTESAKFAYPPYDTQRFQLEAYRRAWHWMGGGWLDGVCLIRIAPDGKYDLRVWDSRKDMREANTMFKGFLACLDLWKACSRYSELNPPPVWMRGKKQS